MHPPCQVSHIQEIVMDTSFIYEGTLRLRDKLVHMWGKPRSHHLGDKLGK
jgi:hypothetical protein